MGNFVYHTSRDLNRLRYVYPPGFTTLQQRKHYPFIHQIPRYETSIIPDCQFWVKADAGIGLSGATVNLWADQSGNANNLTSGAATISENGVIFNGTTNYLAGNLSIQFNSKPSDVFVRAQYVEPLTPDDRWLINILQAPEADPTHGISIFRDLNSSSIFGENTATGVGSTSLVTSDGQGSPATFELRSNPTNIIVAVNSIESSPGPSPSSLNLGKISLAAGLTSLLAIQPNTYLNCIIYEVVIFSRVLNTTERNIVTNYLARWG
jgi:hypothetical protein